MSRTNLTLTRAALALGAVAATSHAGIIRHDKADAMYTALAAEPQFAASGQFKVNGAIRCSATLIAPGWVLSAAHCSVFEPSEITFEVGGVGYGVSEYIRNPGWNHDTFEGVDLALYRLATDVIGINPAQIYTGSNELGATVVQHGYGVTGEAQGGVLSGSQGTARAGTNVYDVEGTDFGLPDTLWADFDSPDDPATNFFGSADPTDLEYLTFFGDSGGASYIMENGQWYVAGVHHAVGGPVDETGQPTGVYGSYSADYRVSSFADWINSTVPTPSAASLLAMGLIGVGRRRR